MPAGGTALGFVYFAAAKFAGYTAFCRWGIQPQVEFALTENVVTRSQPIPSAWKAGALRTLIGVTIGAVVGLAFWRIPHLASDADSVFFAALVPVRIFEWWLLLYWIYRSFPLSKKKLAILIVVGIVVSFALDAIGLVAAWVLPGGIWVC